MDRKNYRLPPVGSDASSSRASSSSGNQRTPVSNPFSIDSILSSQIEQHQEQHQLQIQLGQLRNSQRRSREQQQHEQQQRQQLQQQNEAMSQVKLESPVANSNFLYLLTMMLERQQQAQQQLQQHQNIVSQRQLQQAIIEQQHQQLRQQAQLQQQRNLASFQQPHQQQLQLQQQPHHHHPNQQPSSQPRRQPQTTLPQLTPRSAHSTNFTSAPQPVLPPAPPKTGSHIASSCHSGHEPGGGGKLDSMKPAHSYIGLIGMCILSSPDKRMVLSDIYQFILDKYPYYRNRGSGWRNSVRHNLSLNECFQKAGRAANGKGHFWTIHPANMNDFMAGDFRRRRAQRKVRRWNNMDVPSDESEDEDATKPPLPEHFKRSIEMHQRLEMMRYQKQQAAAASLSMANATVASLSLANAAAAAAAAMAAAQKKRQLQLQTADTQQHQQQQQKVSEPEEEDTFQV